MRNILILLFLTTFQVFADNAYSQITNISLDLEQVTIKSVLQEIEKNSDFFFLYNSKLVDDAKKVNAQFEDEKIDKILTQVFDETDIDYLVMDRQIILSPKEYLSDIKNIMQPITVSGIVTDENGEPLPGLTVTVKGTTRGAVTNLDGKFTIEVDDPSAILVFSYVGYLSQEMAVGNQTTIDVNMQPDVIGIEEVVAIGYGSMRKKDLTGSVASVQGLELSEKSPVRVSQLLQGTIPGLMVTRSGGSAADVGASLRIRGITTIGNSNPLIIIDGIPSNSIDWMNPNDIENISVLKDAASAAIYGSKAAAGVIIVTTKKAKPGKISMTYDYKYTIEQPTRVAEYANAVDYMKVLNEIAWNDNDNIEGGEFPIFSADLIDNYFELRNGNPDEYPITDWTPLMLNNLAAGQKHMIGISAGTNIVSTFVSLNYDKTNALFDGRNYDRITLRANNNININKFFSLDVNLHSLYYINNKPRYNPAPGPSAGTIYAAEWQDGRIAEGKGGDNPYALFKYGGSNKRNSSVVGGKMQLNFTPWEDLKFSAVFSPELHYIKDKFFKKRITYTAYDDPETIAGTIIGASTTSLDEGRDYRLSTTIQFFTNYTKSFNNHNVELLLGYEEYSNFYEVLGASRDEYELMDYPYLDIGNENFQFNNGSAYEYASRSIFGRLTYDYKHKYLFQSNVRYDGSSRFAKDYRWGLFPSFSAGWVLSEEDFMENTGMLSFLKLRASWGVLGNERIGYYPYQSTIGFGSSLLYQGNDVVSVQTAGISDYAIKDISWETTEVLDFGIDANLLANRLRITADYFRKATRNMLLALEIPDFIGLGNPQQNTGKMSTNGWELSIGWSDQIGDLRYSARAHLSDFVSIMGDLGGTEFLGSKVKFEGSEFNEWFGYESEGIYQTQGEVDNSPVLNGNVGPGDIKYKDISGPDGEPDGIISPEYDRVLLGGSFPRFLYGGDIKVLYKGFDFGLVFQGVGKQNSMISDPMVQPLQNPRPSMEVSDIIMGNYWSKYNTDEQNLSVPYPRIGMVARVNNSASSNFWMFNGAYFRLKNIHLGYTLPTNVVSKVRLKEIRLSANVTDLFSIDNYPVGWDPETTSSWTAGWGQVQGYWITRAFTLSISAKF
ncbi:MAG: TonB-dependent receptor [Bacteroidota bacterium]